MPLFKLPILKFQGRRFARAMRNEISKNPPFVFRLVGRELLGLLFVISFMKFLVLVHRKQPNVSS